MAVITWKTPSDPNVAVWRYMDFTKFVSMLSRNGLYFPRADLLNDRFEGTLPTRNTRRDRSGEDEKTKKVLEVLDFIGRDSLIKQIRGWTYINAWHINEFESEAMWRLYAKTEEAVSIRSTFAKLRDAFPEEYKEGDGKFIVAQVSYIDYAKDIILVDLPEWAFTNKRKSFEHEREVRVIVSLRKVRGAGPADIPTGIWVDINLRALIEAVYVRQRRDGSPIQFRLQYQLSALTFP